MAIVRDQAKAQFHPSKRRQVLAAADVRIQQVQVVDKDGRVRNIVVWRSGTDVVFSETMDGLFDTDRRFKAPRWVVEQLDALPPSKQYDFLGNVKSNISVEHEVADENPEGFEFDEDDDIEGVAQA